MVAYAFIESFKKIRLLVLVCVTVNQMQMGKERVEELFHISKIRNINNNDAFSRKHAFFEFSSVANSSNNLPNASTEVECVKAVLPFIWVFRIFGLLPVKISPGYSGLLYRKFSVFKVVIVIGGITQAFLLIKSLRELILLATQTSSDSVTIIDEFMDACKKVEQMCQKYISGVNDHLVGKAWIIFGVIFGAQLFGEVLYYNRVANGGNETATLEEFLAGLDSTALFPNFGSPAAVGTLTLIAELYCDFEWTFGEHLISILAHVITYYFSRLNTGIANSPAKSVTEIEELRRDHRSLKDLVELYNTIFSPILLVTYIGNLSYLLARLYVGVAKDLTDSNVAVLIESLYAFSYLVMKIFLPTWLAAKLHETAHESLDTVHDWPSLLESEDCKYRVMVINRFVSQLVTDPVHFNGCGYFTLTKTFIVTLISGIIGYEVIILQFQQAAGVVQ